MIDSHKQKESQILDAAVKIFAKKGYQGAKLSDISKRANVAVGLIYVYFDNKPCKLDLLLSITLRFWKELNSQILEKISNIQNPINKLKTILEMLQYLLMRDKETLSLAKVLNEALPIIYTVKHKKLKEKRNEIRLENRKFLTTVDEIISEGQQQGIFEKSLNPSIMRQVLYGAVEMILYGLFLKYFRKEEVGYDGYDANKAIERLIYSFLCSAQNYSYCEGGDPIKKKL